jgi:hypothetical protein
MQKKLKEANLASIQREQKLKEENEREREHDKNKFLNEKRERKNDELSFLKEKRKRNDKIKELENLIERQSRKSLDIENSKTNHSSSVPFYSNFVYFPTKVRDS